MTAISPEHLDTLHLFGTEEEARAAEANATRDREFRHGVRWGHVWQPWYTYKFDQVVIHTDALGVETYVDEHLRPRANEIIRATQT